MVGQRTSGPKKIAAAIGNFDGVHRGHVFLIEQTIAFAHDIGAEPGVVVFDPHPRRHFRPDDPPFLLTSPERRADLLREAGAPHVLTISFNAEIAAMSADDFVNRILLGQFGLQGVMTGSEFRFGAGRAGDVETMAKLCRLSGAEARVAELLIDRPQEEKVSSSGVREAIHHGAMGVAARMLGRPWAINGVIEKGQQLGREIGFPTANLLLGDLIEPRRGVYAVDVRIMDEPQNVENARWLPGVANFGRRPTVGAPEPLLEVHIFDFTGDLYGRQIEVAFKSFIRDEKKFDGVEALKAQIAKDTEKARSL